jgi:uncharacterized membrane protein (Fun14 family)
MVTPNQIEQAGFVETIKNTLEPESVATKFGVDKNLLIDVGLYGAIGFIVGFLLKKYSEYFISLAMLIVGLVVLQQFDYISLTINTTKLHNALGLQESFIAGDAYGSLLWSWMRSHVISSSSLVVGFLIGLKVG